MNRVCFIPKEVLNMTLKGKWDQDENKRFGNMSHKGMWKEKLCKRQI